MRRCGRAKVRRWRPHYRIAGIEQTGKGGPRPGGYGREYAAFQDLSEPQQGDRPNDAVRRGPICGRPPFRKEDVQLRWLWSVAVICPACCGAV